MKTNSECSSFMHPTVLKIVTDNGLHGVFPPERVKLELFGTESDISEYLEFTSFCSKYEGMELYGPYSFKVLASHALVRAEEMLFQKAVTLIKGLAATNQSARLKIRFGNSKEWCDVHIATQEKLKKGFDGFW